MRNLAKWVEHSNQSQPNPGPLDDASPCSNECALNFIVRLFPLSRPDATGPLRGGRRRGSRHARRRVEQLQQRGCRVCLDGRLRLLPRPDGHRVQLCLRRRPLRLRHHRHRGRHRRQRRGNLAGRRRGRRYGGRRRWIQLSWTAS